MDPWICPKCGRVYGPFVQECNPCNQYAGYANTITSVTDSPYNLDRMQAYGSPDGVIRGFISKNGDEKL